MAKITGEADVQHNITLGIKQVLPTVGRPITTGGDGKKIPDTKTAEQKRHHIKLGIKQVLPGDENPSDGRDDL